MSIEEINKPIQIDFLPPEAVTLVEPLSKPLKLPEDPIERDRYWLAANVLDITKQLYDVGLVSRKVDGEAVRLRPMYMEYEHVSVVRITDSLGTSEIRVDRWQIDHPMKLMSATFQKPNTKERTALPIEEVPASHWIALAKTKDGLREGDRITAERKQAKRGRGLLGFLRR